LLKRLVERRCDGVSGVVEIAVQVNGGSLLLFFVGNQEVKFESCVLLLDFRLLDCALTFLWLV
jgi:hypothetical protein